MRIGLRQANQRFSKTMKAVKAGHAVVLTERGKPVAVIKPLRDHSKAETVISLLEASGLLRAAAVPRPLPAWRPRPLKGTLVSRTLREERDES
jgi:prevent-host-death family protein